MRSENNKAEKRGKVRVGKPRAPVGTGKSGRADLSLLPDQRDLVLLRDELYDGSWDEMLTDLKNRLEGKPYIFKLVNRIQQDIEMIKELRALEKEKGINLRELL